MQNYKPARRLARWLSRLRRDGWQCPPRDSHDPAPRETQCSAGCVHISLYPCRAMGPKSSGSRDYEDRPCMCCDVLHDVHTLNVSARTIGEQIQAGSSEKKKCFPPLAISSQRVNIWYHTGPHDRWKRVTWPFFLNGLGLSLGAKLASTNDRPSIFSIIFRIFSQRGRSINCAAFRTIRLDVLQGMSVEKFAQKIDDLTCLCSTLSRI